MGIGSARYIPDSAVDSSFVAAYPKASFISANGRGFRLATDQILSVTMFGADPTAATYSSDAFDAALAYLKLFATAGGYAPGTQGLHVPLGKYTLSRSIQLKQSVRLSGEGSGQAAGKNSQLSPDAGVTAIIVHRYNTIGNGVETTPTTSGSGSIIDGLYLQGAGRDSAANADGIWIRERCVVQNCFIASFSRNGVRVIGSGGSGGATEGNANGFTLSRLRIEDCGDDAVFVQGSDVNAGQGINLDISACGGSGICDKSFLGNSWISCEVEGCGYGSANRAPGSVDYGGHSYAVVKGQETAALTTTPGTNNAVWTLHTNAGGYPAWHSSITVLASAPYLVDSLNANSVFLGCYAEAGMGPLQLDFRTIAMGGLLAECGVYAPLGGVWLSNLNSALYCNQSVAVADFTDSTHPTVRLGGEFGNGTILQGDSTSNAFRLRYHGSNDIVFDESNLDSRLVYWVTGTNTAIQMGRPTAQPYAMAIPRLFHCHISGDFGTYARRINTIVNDSDLTGQTLVAGDHFHYISPGIGGVAMQVVTTSGTGGSGAVTAPCGIVGAVQAAHQSNSSASDVAGLLTDFNALLVKLQTAKLMG
jgi:hypothetical protein